MQKKRLIWFNLVRVTVVSLFLVATSIFKIKESTVFDEQSLTTLTVLLVATYLFSIFSLLLLKIYDKFTEPLTYAQIGWDLLFVTILIFITGGISSPFSFLYLLSIISASILLSRKAAFYTASISSILYGAIVDLQYYGVLNPLGLSYIPARLYGAHYIFYAIFVNSVAFYLTALLTGYLSERVRNSESALQEKVINFEELERLNSSIVSNLASGLLTINNEGRIRVFNRYAEQLTGHNQSEAYDQPLFDVIPAFKNFAGDISSVKRGELQFIGENGELMTVGFNSAPLKDKSGNQAGIIINFQDLTHVKKIESELKRADRLAAIGGLAARIAHEIRNPLASVSGSVQLIAQREGIDLQDQKLLDIVIRETDRLNQLINDFLLYARPTPPMKEPVALSDFMDDLIALLRADARFAGISFNNLCSCEINILVDMNQIKQVFWNLLVNASEALCCGGNITISASLQTNYDFNIPGQESIKIAVTDNGIGIGQEELKKIFEPFYTTKKGGSGLGLATVYRIIEAHRGKILVDSIVGKGTTFTIYLPAPKPA